MAKKRMDRTTDYARIVVARKRLVGRKEMLACQRHLDNMVEKSFDYIFDVEMAEKAIDLANELTIGEGTEANRLTTRGFQNFIIGSLHGWRKKRSKELRFRESYVQIGRQNGKSFLSATEVNNRASFSGYHLGKVYCAATKQEQANIVWDEVHKFIISDPELEKLYHVREHERTITSKITGTVFKSVGRDTKSADGFRSILSIIDEYHAHQTNQMYKLLLDGQITVDSALTWAITTAGFNLNGPCYEHYQFCEKVLEGLVKKESLFVYITEMDRDDDIWDYKNWAKANPLLLWSDDLTIDQDMVARMAEKAIEAKEKGGQDLVNFMTKSLNVWVTWKGDSFVDLEKFKGCESDLTLAHMRGKPCYLGIDLSKGGDLTSIALVFPLADEHYYVYSHSFLPELRLLEHERTDDAPYRMWVKEGLLTLTTGGFGIKTDYKFIIAHLKQILEEYEIEVLKVGYDGHNASVFLADLEFLGCDLVEIVQSAKSLNDATVDFRLTVDGGMLTYDKNNALLVWSVANATTTSNSFGEIKVDKQSDKQRIDPVDAVLDAWKIAFLERNTSTYSANEAFDDWQEVMRARKERR